jgi:stress-induced-phosphoprotein 1
LLGKVAAKSPVAEAEEEEAKQAAAAEKALGTAAYKKKNFDTALQHYRKALEMDPTNMVYLLNTSAVFMEKKDFESAIAEATKAVEVGQDNRGDFKLMGKAYGRIAKAHFQMGNLDEASRFYDRSLSNARTPAVLEEKKKLDKAIKEKARLAYIDPEKAKEAKERGNALFKTGDFPGAIKEYSEAIKRDPEEAAFYSNRAACYTKLAEPALALADADKCIEIDPAFLKGYVRRGNSLLAMRKKKEAEEAFAKAAAIDPNHPEVQQGLQRCRSFYSAKPGQSREERAAEAMKDPEIQDIMNDPIMRSILNQMSTDPTAAQEHMKNRDIAAKIQKLLEAGVIGTA